MSREPLVAHSLAEAHFYLMATVCDACGRGSFRSGADQNADDPDGAVVVTVDALCTACGVERSFSFRLPRDADLTRREGPAEVNASDEPSQILDVAQWIMLFRIVTESATKETNRVRARHMGIEAAQCLAEALKFYDADAGDLPPIEACFHDASRKRLRNHPEQFSRTRLLELRRKLPTRSTLESSRKKRWWRFRR